jgi:hypothetical protein
MDITKLKSGDAVELLVDANAIPAGCYRFLEVNGEMSVFSLGHEVIMGFATDFWCKFMRPAAESGAPLSSEGEFTRRYARLYAQLKTKKAPADPSRLTFCILSPRMLRRSGADFEDTVSPMHASDLMH